MGLRNKARKRDVERSCTKGQFVAALRRLADCIEQGKPFRIQVAGERICVPGTAVLNVEHERGASHEEVEFQLRWALTGSKIRRTPPGP